ncbi:aldehyde-activating protein [Betaproteobacteria bacterium GR16-43]|nr:aldehyde-activating protein [Betaproteobacteria bacterium GR16-43]
MTDRTGGCLCGQVRYRIASEPVATRICWCKDCQRISSNGTVNLLVASPTIEVTGNVSAYTRAAESGNQVTRRFCGQCGSQLFADSSGRPGLTVVRVGTLDDPSAAKPSANIWSVSAPAWACLDPALERVERAPLPPQPPKN